MHLVFIVVALPAQQIWKGNIPIPIVETGAPFPCEGSCGFDTADTGTNKESQQFIRALPFGRTSFFFGVKLDVILRRGCDGESGYSVLQGAVSIPPEPDIKLVDTGI